VAEGCLLLLVLGSEVVLSLGSWSLETALPLRCLEINWQGGFNTLQKGLAAVRCRNEESAFRYAVIEEDEVNWS
jgi:hypothetical protein